MVWLYQPSISGILLATASTLRSWLYHTSSVFADPRLLRWALKYVQDLGCAQVGAQRMCWDGFGVA